MHEDNSPIPWEHQIGPAGQPAPMQAEPEAGGMQPSSQQQFRLSVASANPAHVEAALICVEDIHSQQALTAGDGPLLDEPGSRSL